MREIIANEDENDKGGIWTNQFLQRVDKKGAVTACNFNMSFHGKAIIDKDMIITTTTYFIPVNVRQMKSQ